MLGKHELLRSDARREVRGHAEPTERDARAAAFGQHFGDRTAKTAENAVFLQREDGTRLARRRKDGRLVERLQRVHAQDANANPLLPEHVRGSTALFSMPPVEMIVASPPSRSRIALPISN